MTALHVIFAYGLTFAGLVVIIRSLTSVGSTEESGELLPPLTVLLGFLWCGAMFTGFFQLGSTGSIPFMFVIKIGSAFFGGGLLLTVLFLRISGRISQALFPLCLIVAEVLLLVSVSVGILA